jgi:predicted ArsR family transcriptional regulator
LTYYPHPKRNARKNHFPLANAMFDYALEPGALMIFAYLSYLRFLVAPFTGATCRSISGALDMSENTVRKHLHALSRCRLAQIEGGKCVPLGWLQREGAKNFFPLPMEIFQFHLTPGAFAVYAYLLNREHRKTFDCIVSANKIGKATGMSRNTVRKYVGELEEQMLVETERTSVITKKHLKYNGALRYRIIPVQTALDHLHERQLAELDRKRERALAQKKLDKQRKPSAKEVRPVASHVVHEPEELPL